jgi:hypothetical protein
MTVRTPETKHGIGAPAPLGRALTRSEWAQVRRAPAGTDNDELPAARPMSGLTRHGPKRSHCASLTTMAMSVLAPALAALALACPGAAAASAVWLSKPDAHRLAVRATAVTCRAVAWCEGYDVVPASRCRRDEHQTVYCAIAFITAQRQRCGGVVGVSRTRRGRLDQVMAVPQNCGSDNVSGGDRPPPVD